MFLHEATNVIATLFFKSLAWYSARVRESYVYLAVMGAAAWRGFLILSVSAPQAGYGRAEGPLRGRNTALCGIRREKRDGALGEEHSEMEGSTDGGTRSSQGREIGIGKNKTGGWVDERGMSNRYPKGDLALFYFPSNLSRCLAF